MRRPRPSACPGTTNPCGVRGGPASRRPGHSPRIDLAAAGARELAAWANADDATRDGAYAIALGALEAGFGLLATSRAETLTGADY